MQLICVLVSFGLVAVAMPKAMPNYPLESPITSNDVRRSSSTKEPSAKQKQTLCQDHLTPCTPESICCHSKKCRSIRMGWELRSICP